MWGYWISIWCVSAAIAVSLVSAPSTFFPILSTSSVAAVVTGLGGYLASDQGKQSWHQGGRRSTAGHHPIKIDPIDLYRRNRGFLYQMGELLSF